MAIFDENLRCEESHAVVCETLVVTLDPLAFIKVVEIVSPVKVEAVRLLVVAVCFDVIVLRLVWHVAIFEASRPIWELRDPQVHHEYLPLV